MPTELTLPQEAMPAEAKPGQCPACNAANMTDFFESRELPVHVGVVYDTPAEARRAPMGDLTLAYCRDCGFVHNRKFDASLISYEPGYEVALSHSAMFRSFTDEVCNRLIERFGLRGKQIIEIGCGAGYFLKRLCEMGGNHGVGFDTSIPCEGTAQIGNGSVRFVRDYFTSEQAHLPCDFICCLSVAEDIPQPAAFLRDVRRIIGNRQHIGVYFEVFNAFRAFQERETWSIHYEQCNYFSRQSFRSLFERSGFRVLDADSCYGNGQYLYVEAVPTDLKPAQSVTTANTRIPPEVANFAATHQQKLEDWNRRLAEFRARDKRVVVWGSGGKGISFLNSLPTADLIPYVVDINPDRQQKHIPGTAQRIVPPEFLIDYRPDTVILTNPLYEREIRQQLQELGIDVNFLTA